MRVRYTAVNGGIETEVGENTSCLADDSNVVSGSERNNKKESKQVKKNCPREDMLGKKETLILCGKESGEQMTINKSAVNQFRGCQNEVGEEEAELGSVFEVSTSSSQFSGIHKKDNQVKGQRSRAHEEEGELESVCEDNTSMQHFSGTHKQLNKVKCQRSRTQEVLTPVKSACCCRKTSDSHLETQLGVLDGMSKCHSITETVDLDILYEEEPLRKRAQRACFTFVYVILAAVAVLATYSMVNDLVVSVRNPVRSVHYKLTNEYTAPGIAVYPGGADFLACGHYFNNVVTSKIRLTQLDLVNRNCSHSRLLYTDPHNPEKGRDVIVFRGPTSFSQREAIFLHFALEDKTRDFFTVSYFVFDGYDRFSNMSFQEQETALLHYHTYVPTFALSAGLRMWIKLIMSETFLLDGTKHTNFDVEYSVVRFHDSRPAEQQEQHLFFIFFEWKNNLVEQSTLIYSTTPWSVLAGLCGVFLMLHRFYILAKTSYKRVQKDKRKRTLRKETLRRIKESLGHSRREMDSSEVTL